MARKIFVKVSANENLRVVREGDARVTHLLLRVEQSQFLQKLTDEMVNKTLIKRFGEGITWRWRNLTETGGWQELVPPPARARLVVGLPKGIGGCMPFVRWIGDELLIQDELDRNIELRAKKFHEENQGNGERLLVGLGAAASFLCGGEGYKWDLYRFAKTEGKMRFIQYSPNGRILFDPADLDENAQKFWAWLDQRYPPDSYALA